MNLPVSGEIMTVRHTDIAADILFRRWFACGTQTGQLGRFTLRCISRLFYIITLFILPIFCGPRAPVFFPAKLSRVSIVKLNWLPGFGACQFSLAPTSHSCHPVYDQLLIRARLTLHASPAYFA